VLGFSINSFELHGKIKVEESNISAVRIVVTKNGQEYKTFRTEASGKYTFNLDYNNKYIVAFKKSGYITLMIEINTNVTNEVLKWNNYRYKWRVDGYLFKEHKGIDFSFFNKPIQIIYFVEDKERFDVNYKYSKQFQKKFMEISSEIKKKKLEIAKQDKIRKKNNNKND
jgi:hypothetical protein